MNYSIFAQSNPEQVVAITPDKPTPADALLYAKRHTNVRHPMVRPATEDDERDYELYKSTVSQKARPRGKSAVPQLIRGRQFGRHG